jgi:hypothetical protein
MGYEDVDCVAEKHLNILARRILFHRVRNRPSLEFVLFLNFVRFFGFLFKRWYDETIRIIGIN